MKHERSEITVYSRKDIEELARSAAKFRLIGNLYLGSIGEQEVRWREDGGIEIVTHHSPSGWHLSQNLPTE